MSAGAGQAQKIERSCAIVATALSDGRCEKVRLMSGERRRFRMNPERTVVHVPYRTLVGEGDLQHISSFRGLWPRMLS